ncbi:hypothetical protein UFOVP190_416 [uncultured Caudovirales phage]|uniref:Uncharacterized protein n=1 Tax=uncultured Caudovirales phage TaxID=2100421 RepID=A0A6J7WI39_9CAUD|nr:hypothetical protein UFOVP190_416 [uncultured Caudovirales phage]
MTTFKFTVNGKEYIIEAETYVSARQQLKELLGLP